MTDIFLFLILALLFFVAYRLTGILGTLDALADMLGDQLRAIIDQIRRDGSK